MIGSELVNKHRDLCCAAYGMLSTGKFYYTLGLDSENNDDWEFGRETPMQYSAVVFVDPNTGIIKKDYANSILPN